MSALCGCVVAATGASCAITYLMGGNKARISYAIKNMIGNITGMICDGAKPSCAMKVSSGVSTAMLSALMAMEDKVVTSVEGIIDEDVDKSIEWFNRTGFSTVFFCRFIPMVRSLISIPAGFARMKFIPFLMLTTLGSFLWNTILVWVGVAARESWDIIVKNLESYSGILKIILLLFAFAALLYFIWKRILCKDKEQVE